MTIRRLERAVIVDHEDGSQDRYTLLDHTRSRGMAYTAPVIAAAYEATGYFILHHHFTKRGDVAASEESLVTSTCLTFHTALSELDSIQRRLEHEQRNLAKVDDLKQSIIRFLHLA